MGSERILSNRENKDGEKKKKKKKKKRKSWREKVKVRMNESGGGVCLLGLLVLTGSVHYRPTPHSFSLFYLL